MGNSNNKSTDIGKHSLTINNNNNISVLSANTEKKINNLQFLYFTYKIPIKSILNKNISVKYNNYLDNSSKEYYLKLDISDSTYIIYGKKKMYELTYYNEDHNIKFRFDNINSNYIDIIYNITINYNLQSNK